MEIGMTERLSGRSRAPWQEEVRQVGEARWTRPAGQAARGASLGCEAAGWGNALDAGERIQCWVQVGLFVF